MKLEDLNPGQTYQTTITGVKVDYLGASLKHKKHYFADLSDGSTLTIDEEDVLKLVRPVRKTRRVVVELPEGAPEAPKNRTLLYVPLVYNTYSAYRTTYMSDSEHDNMLLKRGVLFSTEEDALAATQAILNAREIPTDYEAAFEKTWQKITGNQGPVDLYRLAKDFWYGALDYAIEGTPEVKA